ncbi:hypothetical protein C1E24_18290 [Pseudoalteromonas phenolica]|uniref:Uncharacterized protein n=1 Tax=Pseudoalteromonas phenolica TaxID=161398 RepID=A0A5R9PXH1_9GAMM|nr:hypothetical protein [Pseudoalteromonas phenolica]TLX45541.1 hypothetical protein C1E24_18290 [Pseudoalteromonas phenolica]
MKPKYSSEHSRGLTFFDVLGLAVCWTAILVLLFFINSSPGAIILGLITGGYLSKTIIKNKK